LDEVVELAMATIAACDCLDDATLLSALEAFYAGVNRPSRYAEVVDILAFLSEDERTQEFGVTIHECLFAPTSPAVLVAASQVLFLLSWGRPQQLAGFFKVEQIGEILHTVEAPLMRFPLTFDHTHGLQFDESVKLHPNQVLDVRRFLTSAIGNYLRADGVAKDDHLIYLVAKWYWRIWGATEVDPLFFPLLLDAIWTLINYNYALVSEKYAFKFLINALICARKPGPPCMIIRVLEVFLLRDRGFFSQVFLKFDRRELIYKEFLRSPDPDAVAAFLQFIGLLGSAGDDGMTQVVFDEIPMGTIWQLVTREDGPPVVRAAFARMCGFLMTTDVVGCDFLAEFCAAEVILFLNALAHDDEADVRLAAIKTLTDHFGQFSRETQINLLKNEFIEHMADMYACLGDPSDAIRAVDEILDVVQEMPSGDQTKFIEVIHDTGIIGEMTRVNEEEIDDEYDDDEVEKVRKKWDAILGDMGFDRD
jgi:hypothetical protein